MVPLRIVGMTVDSPAVTFPRWSTPLKPLEALAHRVPVVATRTGGHPELILRHFARFVAVSDPYGITCGLCELAASPAASPKLRITYTRRGRTAVYNRLWQSAIGHYAPV